MAVTWLVVEPTGGEECPWLSLMGLGGTGEDDGRGSVKDPTYKCDPSVCEKQCKKCTNSRCKCLCPCCKSRNGGELTTNCDSHSGKPLRSLPSSSSRGSASHGHASASRAKQQTGSSSTTASTPIPYIIASVALIILVICVMSYFRIRPFHRVLYLLRS
ncbi:hypothetical protein BBBOND_0305620 [Babesia bigemina]|uniref:Uncharacterized protein n=1 Tax=Babesia bigemina TaxID=5866 RepID=A0A061DCE2_BABBI|nr:hypothetical protein BBBOND_0305620 [Babesia bigemina]CDR96659.1 hypothetical protein BBBOND_0305620 [Babesia bigemina]|eukprot:XP_012768845.1 hypothetical protein BBBOND_0305620 [Babesia bigemina]